MVKFYYIHRTFEPSGAEPRETTYVRHDLNPLDPEPDSPHYENYIQYYNNSDKTYINRFDCGISAAPRGKVLRERIDSPLFFKYVVSGTLDCNGKTLGPGDCIFLDPYVPNSWFWQSDTMAYWCAWQGDIAYHVAQHIKDYRSGEVYHLGIPDVIQSLFHSVIYNHYYGAINVNQFISGFTEQLLAILPAIDNRVGRAVANPLVKRAIDLIEQEYHCLTVEALAGRLFVDASHLARAFRREIGISPKQYITRTKLNYAEYYLVSTRHTIQRIADMVGYANYTNFYVAFRQHFGMAPDEYRRLYGKRD